VCFVDRCLSLCTFSFGHCVVCSSSIYGFWLPIWNLQTLLDHHCWNFLFIILFDFIFSYYAAPPDESNPHVYDGISPIYDLPDEDDHHGYEKANSNITDVHGYECLNHDNNAISSWYWTAVKHYMYHWFDSTVGQLLVPTRILPAQCPWHIFMISKNKSHIIKCSLGLWKESFVINATGHS